MINYHGSPSQNNGASYRLDYKTGQSQLFSTSKANGESHQVWIPKAYIFITLQHRWPHYFLEFVITDVDDMNRSVQDVDNHLKPGVDPLHLDEPTLSRYRQEMICKGPGKRTDMLSTLKDALSATRTIRGMAVEVDLFTILAPEFENAGSWKKTLNLPKCGNPVISITTLRNGTTTLWLGGLLAMFGASITVFNQRANSNRNSDLLRVILLAISARPRLTSINNSDMMPVTLPDTPSMTRVEVHSARKK